MQLEREMEVVRSPNSYIDSYRRHISWEGGVHMDPADDVLLPEERERAVAAMLPEDIARLMEYSTSTPTGVVHGKVWKARYGETWVLCQYVRKGEEWFIQRNEIREIGVLERRRLQVERHQAEVRTRCRCDGLGLQLGDWMGPTRQAPYPRRCVCSPDLTAREVQSRWTTYLEGLRVDATVPGIPTLPADVDPFTRWHREVWPGESPF